VEIEVLACQPQEPPNVLRCIRGLPDGENEQHKRCVCLNQRECNVFPRPRVVPARPRSANVLVTVRISEVRPVRDVDGDLWLVQEVVAVVGDLKQRLVGLQTSELFARA